RWLGGALARLSSTTSRRSRYVVVEIAVLRTSPAASGTKYCPSPAQTSSPHRGPATIAHRFPSVFCRHYRHPVAPSSSCRTWRPVPVPMKPRRRDHRGGVWLGGDHSWAWGRTPNGPRPELSHTRNVSYVRMAQCHADGLRPIVTLGTVTGSTKPRVWPTCLVLHKPMAGPI